MTSSNPPVAPMFSGKSPGNGIVVSQVLGYLLTDTSFGGGDGATSSSSIVKAAITKSGNVWRSYVLSDYSLGQTQTASFLLNGIPKRSYDAAYYYALEFITEEYVRLRIGQLGLNPSSRFVEQVLAKADKLYAIAEAGIKAYEEWCQTTASLICADTIELVAGAVVDYNEGVDLADAYWKLIPCDIQAMSYSDQAIALGPQFELQKHEFAFGHSLRKVGSRMMQRNFGKTSGRNPAVATYYQSSGQLLVQQGTVIMDSWKAWAEKNKSQLSSMIMGL